MELRSCALLLVLLWPSAAPAADATSKTDERVYQQPRERVFHATVAAFKRLNLPVTTQRPETGTVVAETHTGASAFAKFYFITATTTQTPDGTHVAYTRETMRSINTTRKIDRDASAAADFFKALDVELAGDPR